MTKINLFENIPEDEGKNDLIGIFAADTEGYTPPKQKTKAGRPRLSEEPTASKKKKVASPSKAKNSLDLANEELDFIIDSYNEFMEKISTTVLYNHLYKESNYLLESIEDLETLINDDIDKSMLSDLGKSHHDKILKIRESILKEISNHYKKS